MQAALEPWGWPDNGVLNARDQIFPAHVTVHQERSEDHKDPPQIPKEKSKIQK